VKPAIESALREGMAHWRVAREMTRGQVDRAIGTNVQLDWDTQLMLLNCAMGDAEQALTWYLRHIKAQRNDE